MLKITNEMYTHCCYLYITLVKENSVKMIINSYLAH